MSAWITVVGIGEDGLDGLSPANRALVEKADVLAGGARHLGKAPKTAAVRIDWRDGLDAGIEAIAGHQGRRVVVLASGDPLNFGIAANLICRFGAAAVRVIPAAGAFSLAAARMGWPLAEVACLTVHGRALEAVNLHLVPGRKLLVLSRDGKTPAALARLLTACGFGASAIAVLEHMGGPKERRIDGRADRWRRKSCADLNTVAVDCVAAPSARFYARVPGLPDDAFEHDGQITKREVRAATLARLMPLPGQTLWDVGAGSGAVAVEWLRAEGSAEAVAVERDAERAERIGRNARALGVPRLKVVEGEAPAALRELSPRPDAVFVGGGVARARMLEACWRALKPGGRLVANAVTLEAQARLIAFRADHGGDLVRISVARAEPVGELSALRPLMDVLQFAVVKERGTRR
jgi:precorrin-6Y C5,15-methyltransferase (decarboxylating)